MRGEILKPEVAESEESLNTLADWKLEVQESVYQILELWVTESKETLFVLQELRDQLAEASVYGSYTDQARAITVLRHQLETGIDSIMRIVGQFDSPTHVANTLNEGHRGAPKPYEKDVDALSPLEREQLVSALRALVNSAKSMVASRASVALPAAGPEKP